MPGTDQSIPATTEEIRRCYDENAKLFALFEPIIEYLGLRQLRRRLIGKASGHVLEVAVGTGANLPYYPAECRITAIDVSPSMLEIARQQARKLGRDVNFQVMDAEHLDFPDDHFDTVVSALSTCTFIDPVAALQEMYRVCRPDGRILLLEHGRSSWEWLGRWQDRKEDWHARQTGCHWNRESLELVRRAGLRPVHTRRSFFGIFHEIVASPSTIREAV